MRGEICSISEIAAADWDNCFSIEAENHAYYAGLEQLEGRRFKMGGLCVRADGQLVAVAPYMQLDYRLDTPLQGAFRHLSNRIVAIFPNFLSVRAVVLGSPLAERCHIGFAPQLDAAGRQAAFMVLMQTLQAYARTMNIGLTGIKDLCAPDETLMAQTLQAGGYSRMASLPVAVVDLPFATRDDYLAALSVKMRADLRRKLRKRKDVHFEISETIAGLESEIYALYCATQQQSDVDYGDIEHVPPDYFSMVTQQPGRALYLLYWVEGRLAAFNLLLIEPDRIIDKYIGMRYPLARQHNLYYIRWMDAVDYCLAHRVPLLQSGQTAYREKLRLGARLIGSAIYFRHSNGVLNRGLRILSRWFNFETSDPTLKTFEHE